MQPKMNGYIEIGLDVVAVQNAINNISLFSNQIGV